MPSVLRRASEHKHKFLKYARNLNQGKIDKVLEMYKDKANVSFSKVENIAMTFCSPSLLGREKVEKCMRTF